MSALSQTHALAHLVETDATWRLSATHDGSVNFSIQVLDAKNQPTVDLLVNTIGAYSGTSAYGLNGTLGDAGVSLKVTADGNWAIRLAPISSAPELAASGTGDAVYLYSGDAATLALTHDGSSNFSVVEHTDGPMSVGLLVNEIGKYKGTVPISSGPSVVDISADGHWVATLG